MGTVRVLIDANIYLDLYSSKDLRELLTTLPTIEGLFVSAQIVDEVARRRVGVTAEAFKPAMESTKAALPIPEAALLEFSEEVTREIEKFTGAAQALRSKLALSVTETLRKVADAADPVSEALSKIFRDAETPTEAELSRARLRRERGSPPGKFGNPLGDQLTWEQFLGRCHGAHHIFVVSRDADFLERWNGELFLNPVLRGDLRKVAPSAAVEVFSNLASSIPALRKAIGAAVAVPPPETLEKAKKAEEDVAARGSLAALHAAMGLEGAGAALRGLQGWDSARIAIQDLGLAAGALDSFRTANSALAAMVSTSNSLDSIQKAFAGMGSIGNYQDSIREAFAGIGSVGRFQDSIGATRALGRMGATPPSARDPGRSSVKEIDAPEAGAGAVPALAPLAGEPANDGSHPSTSGKSETPEVRGVDLGIPPE